MPGLFFAIPAESIELGRRKVTVEEWLLLAAALNVPPPLLLLPLGVPDHVAITPNSEIHPHLALKWLVGRSPLATTDRKAIGTDEWYKNAEVLRLHQTLEELQDSALQTSAFLRHAEYLGDEERTAVERKNFAAALQKLWDLTIAMRRAGVEPPVMPDEWKEKMREIGIDTTGAG
nr:hypothetical protein [Actinomycetota bacterium]